MNTTFSSSVSDCTLNVGVVSSVESRSTALKHTKKIAYFPHWSIVAVTWILKRKGHLDSLEVQQIKTIWASIASSQLHYLVDVGCLELPEKPLNTPHKMLLFPAMPINRLYNPKQKESNPWGNVPKWIVNSVKFHTISHNKYETPHHSFRIIPIFIYLQLSLHYHSH